MRKDQIKLGAVYTDGKEGVRRVVDEGEHCQFYQGVNYTDGIRYEVLAARSSVEVGTQVCVSRTTMAQWAKREIPVCDLEVHLLQLQAARVASKLTPAQATFMRSFDAGETAGSHIECHRDEWRAVRSCHKKALIHDMPLTLCKKAQHFDVVLSQLGQAVVDHLHASEEVES
jgi:hypothetical protein